MLEEKRVVDQIEVTGQGFIGVQTINVILRDGVEVARSYHRKMIAPGDDLSAELPDVVSHASIAWTPEVVAAYKAAQVKPALDVAK